MIILNNIINKYLFILYIYTYIQEACRIWIEILKFEERDVDMVIVDIYGFIVILLIINKYFLFIYIVFIYMCTRSVPYLDGNC